jgi:hypothetical protein
MAARFRDHARVETAADTRLRGPARVETAAVQLRGPAHGIQSAPASTRYGQMLAHMGYGAPRYTPVNAPSYAAAYPRGVPADLSISQRGWRR